MTAASLNDLDLADAEVTRLRDRLNAASQRHAKLIAAANAELARLTSERDRELASIDRELAAACAVAGKAFDAILTAKRSAG